MPPDNQSDRSRRQWPIIVGGCHRSGTSLVRRILNSHSRIYCGPEVKFFRDFYGNYLVDPLRHARFTQTARSLLPEAELLEVLGHAYVAVQQRAAARAGKPRWADKNPENVLYLDDWQRLLGDEWLFVHVVRNPLDTLASIKEVRFPLIIPAELEERIDHYRRYVEAGLVFARAHSTHYYRITYEQLVASPEQTIRDWMGWLGESFEPAQVAFNAFPHQNGLEDSKVAATSEVHSESVGRWSAILSEEETKVIWGRTHDLWSVLDPEGRCLRSLDKPMAAQ